MQGDRQEKTSSGLPSLQTNCNLLFVKSFFMTNLSDKTRVIHKKHWEEEQQIEKSAKISWEKSVERNNEKERKKENGMFIQGKVKEREGER